MKRSFSVFFSCIIAMLAWGQSVGSNSVLDLSDGQNGQPAVWQMAEGQTGTLGLSYRLPATSTADITFMGNIVQDAAWQEGEKAYGLYTFNASSPGMECVYQDKDGIFHSEYGGCVINDVYHMVMEWSNSIGITVNYKYAFNLNTMTWESSQSYVIPDQNDLSCLAWTNTPYDKSTGLAYGFFFSSDGANLVFGSINYEERLKVNTISTTDRTFLALAIDDVDAQLYGIDSDGCLFKIDKLNGNLTLVGATGLVPSMLHQAADIESSLGKMYWTFIDKNMKSGLACVSLEDAQTTVCYEYDRLVQFGDFFITSSAVNAAAPAVVSQLEWKANEDDFNKVDVSFTMPETTNDGVTAILGTLKYVLSLGDSILLQGDALPGEAVAVTLDELPVGKVSKVAVKAANDFGEGEAVFADVWAGPDMFALPEGVSLTVKGSKASLSWNAVTSSLHGGYADLSDVEYHVMLMQEGGAQEMAVTKQLEYDFDIDTQNFGFLVMGVKASSPDGIWHSDIATSNRVQIGKYAVPPLDFSFSDSITVGGWWQVVDANDDGRKWFFDEQNKCMAIPTAVIGEGTDALNDDWLVSVPMYLDENLKYKLSLSGCFDSTEVRLCQDGVDGYTAVLIAQGDGETMFEGTAEESFMPAASGVYRLAFCEMGSKPGVRITGISIAEGLQLVAPKVVEDFVVTPAPQGEKKATLSFKAPTMSIADQPLEAISYVELMRDSLCIANLHDVTPGETVTYVDEGIKVSGLYKYSVRVVNEYGAGEWRQDSAYVGIDMPVEPQDVYMVDEGDGNYSIHWQTPEIGVNGGYVNKDSITYFIFDVVDGEPAEQVATVIGQNSYSAKADLEGAPGWFNMAVSAMCIKEKEPLPDVPDGDISIFDGNNPYTVPDNVISDGSEVLANGLNAFEDDDEYYVTEAVVASLIKGTPMAMPFAESFAGKTVTTEFWWSKVISGSSQWSFSDISVDDDGGSMAFSPLQQDDKAVVGTRKLTLGGMAHPTLLFWYRADANAGGSIAVEVNRGQRSNNVDHAADFALGADNADGEWKLGVVDLADYAEESYVIISFVAEGVAPGAVVAFDKVSIEGNRPGDLAVAVDAPEKIYTGKETDINVMVSNLDYLANGSTSGSYAVKLVASFMERGVQKDSVLLDVAAEELMPYDSQVSYVAHFSTTPFVEGAVSLKAEVVYMADGYAENNVAEASMTAQQNDVPAITDLEGIFDEGSVALSWTNPVAEGDDPLDIVGYKVYVDGVCHSVIEGMTETADISPMEDESREIYVTVLYGEERVESPLSNLATITTSILKMAVGADINDLDVTVFATNGSVVADGRGAAARLPKGVYVVRVKASGEARTVVVR